MTQYDKKVELAGGSPNGAADLTRPCRALIGWMPSAQAEMTLTGNTMGKEVTGEQRELARRARGGSQSARRSRPGRHHHRPADGDA